MPGPAGNFASLNVLPARRIASMFWSLSNSKTLFVPSTIDSFLFLFLFLLINLISILTVGRIKYTHEKYIGRLLRSWRVNNHSSLLVGTRRASFDKRIPLCAAQQLINNGILPVVRFAIAIIRLSLSSQ